MFKFQLAERLGKTMGELESAIGSQELLQWQIYFNQEYWRERIKNETSDGKSQALMSLIMGKNG